MLLLFFLMAPLVSTLPIYFLFLLAKVLQAFIFYMLASSTSRELWNRPTKGPHLSGEMVFLTNTIQPLKEQHTCARFL